MIEAQAIRKEKAQGHQEARRQVWRSAEGEFDQKAWGRSEEIRALVHQSEEKNRIKREGKGIIGSGGADFISRGEKSEKIR